MSEKTRICAYCRVSTKDKEQLNSLENQKRFFLREFGESENCELICLYADVGRSGTSLHRPEFDRMIHDAGIDKTKLNGDLYHIVAPPKFQRILVKNTSRFARNVSSDLLIKTLTANNVFIDFIDTGLSTENPGDLLTLQLLQAMDEHESRDKSRKIIFGMQEGVRQGTILSHGNFYGYRYYPKPENRLVAIPEEAAVVRLIFQLYVENGYGVLRICRELAAQGIRTRKGAVFNENTVLKMIQNETYTGYGVRNKYQGFRIFSAHRSAPNPNPVIFETDRIDAIIDRETFFRAQEIRKKRRHGATCPQVCGHPSYFTGKLFCAVCGHPYYSSGYAIRPDGGRVRRFYCRSRIHKNPNDPHFTAETCGNIGITEQELFDLVNGSDFSDALRAASLEPATLSLAEKAAAIDRITVSPDASLRFTLL